MSCDGSGSIMQVWGPLQRAAGLLIYAPIFRKHPTELNFLFEVHAFVPGLLMLQWQPLLLVFV